MMAGIAGDGDKEVDDLIKMIKRNKKSQLRWIRTKVLIIDESACPAPPVRARRAWFC